MIARAASAALALLAGSLVASRAAAEPPPPLAVSPSAESAPPGAPVAPVDAPPVVAPPGYAAPGYPPPGYAPPSPMIWRDDAWYEAGTSADVPRPPARDPLFATGIVIGVTGILTTALGTGLFVSGSSAQETCGLSGCIDLTDRRKSSAAAAVIAGGVGATLFGGALAFAGARGPVPVRRSNARMVAGLVFTALGAGALGGSVAQAALYRGSAPLPGEVFPSGDAVRSAHGGASPVSLLLTSATCFAVGIPLWLTGARVRAPAREARAAASSLDVLPSAGGLALRWTR